MSPVILLVIDGLGDLPTPKTPLQAAKKPNLDALARGGITGLVSTIGRGVTPGSDVSHLQLFGYDPRTYYPGRGPLEALGLGMEMREGDIAFRANFATAKEGQVVDRRAGRISTGEARRLEKDVNMTLDDVQVIFRSSVEHRGALILRGPDLGANVTDTDTHHEGSMPGCQATDKRAESRKTAEIVDQFTAAVQKALAANPVNQNRTMPANIVLLRSAGTYRKVPPMSERFGITGACVAGGALYKGVARYVGMEVVEVPGATGTAETDLKAKAKVALELARQHDFVFVHVKACDSFGHDGNFKGKTRMLERIDKELVGPLRKSGACLAVTGDHSTPCVRKAHSGHEVPILAYGKNERTDSVKKFDEIACMAGGLGHLNGADVMPMILDLVGKGKMVGS